MITALTPVSSGRTQDMVTETTEPLTDPAMKVSGQTTSSMERAFTHGPIDRLSQDALREVPLYLER